MQSTNAAIMKTAGHSGAMEPLSGTTRTATVTNTTARSSFLAPLMDFAVSAVGRVVTERSSRKSQLAPAAELSPFQPALSGNESTSAEGNNHFESLSIGVLFTTMLIFLGGTLFMTHRDRIPLPYTVVLFLYGIVVGAMAKLISPDVASALGAIPPELLFYIFLPVLIFEGSFAMNVHALRRVFWQTLLLATVGILINTAILGVAVKVVYMDWSWYAALLLGSLLSATDPVAVVALLKNLRVEKHITAMVDGEAVMNDGTAIIVFTLLLPAAKYGQMTDPAWYMLLNCVRLSLLPVVIGPAFGFLQSFWLRRAKDGLTRACVTVSVTYVSYYVAAHWIGASGVLTLFFQGVFLSYYCPSLFPGVEGGNLISSTWEFLVHIGNTMLFSLVGVILVADVVPTIDAMDIIIIVGLYIAMMAARLVMLEVLLPVMNRFSFQMTQNTVLLLTHAGLRGGVAATLALAVQQGGLKEGIPILKVTCGVVLLTLLINATTAAYVVGRLGFKSKDEYRVRQVQYAMEYLYHAEEKAFERVKRDTKYRNANWLSVERYVSKSLRNPFTGMEILEDVNDDAVINRLLMTAFKTALWRQRDEQVISETVVMQLGQIVSEKIEAGELFYISEMQLYANENAGRHAESFSGTDGPAASTAHSTARRSPAGGSFSGVPGTSSSGSSAFKARQGTTPNARVSPRLLPVVVDIPRPTQRGDGPGLHEEEELPMPSIMGGGGAGQGGCPLGDGGSVVSRAPSLTRQSSWGALESAPESPVTAQTPGGGGGGGSATDEHADAMVEALMGRLLPAWAVLAERLFFGKGYFVSAHRRAQENAFMSLLAVVKCLTVMSTSRYQYVKTEEQARRVESWFSRQLQDGNSAIRFFYNNFPEATNTVSSSRAVISVVNELQEAVEVLHTDHGVSMHVKELLEGMTNDIRENIPISWENDAPKKESDLVTQAVAATSLGKGLRKSEIRAIATMALVKQFHEYDIITLPENAFLIVVFGSLRALHSRWTTINQHEWMESFGDTVGLETLLLPAELCKDRQRQWQVISGEATALLISFNSIKPFLSERSLRSVKALWRAAAAEVVLPLLESMLTPHTAKSENAREHLTSIVMQGTPLIGPEECARFDYSSQFHLCFYLRGSDVSGMFNGHSPPCYISAFYANQLVWRDPNVVLYAVPMNISDSGYVPWNLHRGVNAAAAGATASEAATACREESGQDRSEGDEEMAAVGSGAAPPSHTRFAAATAPGPSVTAVSVAPTATPAAAGSTYADAESLLNCILQGIVPREIEHGSRSNHTIVCGGSGDRPSSAAAGAVGRGAARTGLSRLASEAFLGPSQNTSGLFPRTPGASQADCSGRDLPRSGEPVCVLQDLTAFVTPIPYVNVLFAHYAAQLELLCMAALRYMRYPEDELHVRHAQHTAETTLEFLLSFAVELSLLRRAVRTIIRVDGSRADGSSMGPPPTSSRDIRSELSAMDGGEPRGEEVDADFQCKVCAWSRQAAATKKYHLKTLISEMNRFANRRFRRYAALLKHAVELQPRLANVESVEGMQKMLRSLHVEASE